MSSIVERARRVAERAHAGQVDKAGAPYITHPERVAARVSGDPAAEAVAWLHDVVEDCDVTPDDLRAHGFDEDVVTAVEALTFLDGDDRDAYYARIAANPLALTVKLADLADNSDPARLSRLDGATRARLERKYAHAYRKLMPPPPPPSPRPPPLPGGTAGRLTSADGTVLGTCTAGTGPPVLLVHGGLTGMSRWAPLWQEMVPHARVTAFDRRGRGSSGDGPAYDLRREYEDVAAVADQVAREAGREVDVLGHSYGAICALGSAGLGAPIRRLALYEPPGPATVPPAWRARIRTLFEAGQPGPAVVSFLVDVVGLRREEVMAHAGGEGVDDVLAVASRTLVREGDALADLDLAPLAAGVLQPVLLLLGTASPPWAGEITRTLAELLPSAALTSVEGHGHEGVDTAAGVVAGELLRFFR